MNFQLYKEDIFQILKQDDMFQAYTMDQLVLDLNALVKWKNLTPIQDPGRVYTIAEYKNKQYHVLINGETGRVQGEYPKSVAKILLVIAGILILIGLFFMATDAFACGAKGVPVAETAQEEYIEYEPLTVDIDGIQEV